MTYIDLFAGVGGFRFSMDSVGAKCVFSSEWDKNAQKTYSANHFDVPFGDITLEETKKLIPDNFDVLCAGFPCQAFSIAGLRRGFEETRGTLFFDIADIVNRRKPKVVFLENVKNLVSHDKGNTFRVIVKTLEDLGYFVYYKVLNSMHYANVPQNRERIFIVAFNKEKVSNYQQFVFPKEEPLVKSIHDVIDISDKKDDKYYYKEDHKYYPLLKEAMQNRNTLYQWRRIYVRENKSNVCPTLTANMGTGGHNVPILLDDFGIRKLTPRECFAFQGFPKSFILPKDLPDSKLYMQAGNTVTLPLVKKIATQIQKLLC